MLKKIVLKGFLLVVVKLRLVKMQGKIFNIEVNYFGYVNI